MIDPATRCRHPIKYYELDGRPRTDLFPVCWRPRGHPEPGRHQSEFSYKRMLARGRARRRAQRRAALAA